MEAVVERSSTSAISQRPIPHVSWPVSREKSEPFSEIVIVSDPHSEAFSRAWEEGLTCLRPLLRWGIDDLP